MGKSIFEKAPESSYHETPPSVDFTEFKKVVESRRSIRVYKNDKIPESVVKECLRLALLAPTSSNLQCWEFYWVRNPVKKAELIKACFSQPAAQTAAELIVCVARTDTWQRIRKQILLNMESSTSTPESAKKYYQKIVPFIYSQGLFSIFGFIKKIIFFVTGFFKVVPRSPTSFSEMLMWAHKTCALACENLMLSFRAAGYDSCPMEGFDEVRVKKILDLPRGAAVTMVISAGIRAERGVYGPRFRLPSEQFIFEIN